MQGSVFKNLAIKLFPCRPARRVLGGIFVRYRRGIRAARKGGLLLWDLISCFCSAFLSFLLTGENTGDRMDKLILAGISFAVVMLLSALRGGYSRHLSEMDMLDFASLTLQCLVAAIVAAVLQTLLRAYIHMRVHIVFAMLLILFSVLGRTMAKHLVSFGMRRIARKKQEGDIPAALVYGAGSAGRYFYDGTLKGNFPLRVVAFADDDESLWGQYVGGVRIVGGMENVERLLAQKKVGQVVVAIPTISGERMKEIFHLCQKYNVPVTRFAALESKDDLGKAQMRPVKIEDLLHRERIELDLGVAQKFLKDKVVMVTGGAGSIGSEICRQVLAMGCKTLVVFDIHENGLFYINNELIGKGYGDRIAMRLGSVRDRKRLDEVMDEFSPRIVFHAAAHKHVPMMEWNPAEAIKNNVFGTANVCSCCVAHKVEKFILISTDKAVNPTNIMGASKRIAELVIQQYDRAGFGTEFSAVRFGNVLGSEGSVVPFFLKQIAAGGPVTVTDPEMRRYFMTIPEAVQLVLEAGALAKGGEIFVLDMGEPVRIYDMACDLIRLSGFEPEKDIKITFTGLRPGEKMFEELNMSQEDVDSTSNRKIFIMKPIPCDEEKTAAGIERLRELTETEKRHEMFRQVKELVPTFRHEL